MADDNEDIPYEKDGGGTAVTLIVGGLIALMVVALIALLYLAFSN
ncbi:hypothetical protein [Paractinoplanes toevensis]|uniref:Uncharacterized protein n=1 Tax=Paractinoplanes toevensis TaxID=571911 RepID=A0A919THE9_9ACTN|nr:hypothetical protein [Actinoplanes toevensis]GIM95458.1 hypothetical protein Ato02nite_072510 [Actinoplanes toevensis]